MKRIAAIAMLVASLSTGPAMADAIGALITPSWNLVASVTSKCVLVQNLSSIPIRIRIASILPSSPDGLVLLPGSPPLPLNLWSNLYAQTIGGTSASMVVESGSGCL